MGRTGTGAGGEVAGQGAGGRGGVGIYRGEEMSSGRKRPIDMRDSEYIDQYTKARDPPLPPYFLFFSS